MMRAIRLAFQLTLGFCFTQSTPAQGPVLPKPNKGPTGPQRPNIILIVADDLGYGDLGSYGQQYTKTPFLDLLAAEGVRFTQAYAGAPIGSASRASLMTGLHTGHSYIRGNKNVPLRTSDITIAEMLRHAWNFGLYYPPLICVTSGSAKSCWSFFKRVFVEIKRVISWCR